MPLLLLFRWESKAQLFGLLSLRNWILSLGTKTFCQWVLWLVPMKNIIYSSCTFKSQKLCIDNCILCAVMSMTISNQSIPLLWGWYCEGYTQCHLLLCDTCTTLWVPVFSCYYILNHTANNSFIVTWKHVCYEYKYQETSNFV